MNEFPFREKGLSFPEEISLIAKGIDTHPEKTLQKKKIEQPL